MVFIKKFKNTGIFLRQKVNYFHFSYLDNNESTKYQINLKINCEGV